MKALISTTSLHAEVKICIDWFVSYLVFVLLNDDVAILAVT
jgi:hypothetical protein